MPKISCPHCGKHPEQGFRHFLPWFNIVRREFVCSECSGVSLFSGKAEIWAYGASLANIGAAALLLRAMGVRSITGLLAVGFLAGIVALHQLVSAATLRHFASLVPVSDDGS
jgi:hypothetical protein